MEEHNCGSYQDSRILPAGAFVRPIVFEYLPKHITDKASFFNPETEVYVYCRYGITLIQKNKLREV